MYSDNPSLKTIYLPDNAPVYIGRTPETNITDTKCSRQQVRLYANYTEHTILVQQIGARACGLNGFKTRKEVKFIARHDDCLEVLYGKYPYKIEFNPPPVKPPKQISKKRPYEPEMQETENKDLIKMFKSEDTFSDSIGSFDMNEEEEAGTSSVSAVQKDTNPKNTVKENNTVSDVAKSWENVNNGELLVYTAAGTESRTKIAAYDMDGTLIKTKSGLVFPKDCNDWQLLYPDVPGKLKKLYSEGYKIVIFTNQGRLGSGKMKVNDFKGKIEKIVQKLGIPIQAFIATGEGIYRKPATGMWEALEEKKNEGISIDKTNSFFVGDAAGRQKNWAPGKKKDHSSVDRLLALNLGLRFQTPEEHFLGHKTAPFILPTFNPKNIPQTGAVCKPGIKIISDNQEMILMVGCPGSGKSHFAKHYLNEYQHVNRDSLGSWQKCVSAIEKFLADGKRVVVDNTNPDRSSRQRYIDVAKKRNIPVRCFVMSVTIEHAKHNNKFRELTDRSHVKVGEVIINSYMKNYVPPALDEGFTEILEINFVPKFQNEEHRKLYEMYLLES